MLCLPGGQTQSWRCFSPELLLEFAGSLNSDFPLKSETDLSSHSTDTDGNITSHL
jgi:hypothetical protein